MDEISTLFWNHTGRQAALTGEPCDPASNPVVLDVLPRLSGPDLLDQVAAIFRAFLAGYRSA
jgi:hypothetical protein